MRCGRPDKPFDLRLTEDKRRELLAASKEWARTEWINKPEDAREVLGHDFLCPICLEPVMVLSWQEKHATRVFVGCPTCNLATGDVYYRDPKLEIDLPPLQGRYQVWTYQRYQELIGRILRDISGFVQQRNQWIVDQNAVLETHQQPVL